MEDLIRQAFLHVEGLGPHVQDGHYDLIGPNGEILLPRVWETTIEPGWAITMHMWPIPEPRKPWLGPPPPPHFRHPRPPSRHAKHSKNGSPVPGTPPPSRNGSGGLQVIVKPALDPPGSRHSKSKIRGWMKKANKLFSIKDKDGKLNLSILPPLLEIANKMRK